jgi:hypothetical protein
LGAALNFYDAHAVSVQIEDTNPHNVFIIFLLQNHAIELLLISAATAAALNFYVGAEI